MMRQYWFWMMCVAMLLGIASTTAAQNPPVPPTAPQVPQGRAAQADTDHDGKLSFEEAKAAFPNMTEERFKALDKNADGFLTPDERPKPPAVGTPAAREQARRQLIARIKRADANQDGKLTLEEAQKEFPRMTPERFKSLDKNGDGTLTPDEFAQAKPQGKPGPSQAAPAAPGQARQQMVHRFKKADKDGDHRLSQEEAKAAFPNMPDERFKALDKNADGYLTPNELPAPQRPHKSAGEKPIKNGKANKPIKNKGNGNV